MHDGLVQIGVAALHIGGDGFLESLAQPLAVLLVELGVLTGATVQNLRLRLGRLAEVLQTQVVDDHHRVESLHLLGARLGAGELVDVDLLAALVDRLGGRRNLRNQFVEETGGGIVVAVLQRLLEERVLQDVLLTLLHRFTPHGIRFAREVLRHGDKTRQGQSGAQQKFHLFHDLCFVILSLSFSDSQR